MVASKDSWKWKVAVGFIALVVFTLGFIFTEYGRTTMMGWMTDAYNETPENERVTQKAADYWLTLCWFEGFIKTNNKQAAEMYMEFLAIKPDVKTGKNIFQLKGDSGSWKWNGKFDGKTKTGWGPLHERAPEAYYDFMKVWERDNSLTYIGDYAMGYYHLFFKVYPQYSKTGKPHPKAYKYWGKIKIMITKCQYPIPKDIPKKPPEYEDEDTKL